MVALYRRARSRVGRVHRCHGFQWQIWCPRDSDSVRVVALASWMVVVRNRQPGRPACPRPCRGPSCRRAVAYLRRIRADGQPAGGRLARDVPAAPPHVRHWGRNRLEGIRPPTSPGEPDSIAGNWIALPCVGALACPHVLREPQLPGHECGDHRRVADRSRNGRRIPHLAVQQHPGEPAHADPLAWAIQHRHRFRSRLGRDRRRCHRRGHGDGARGARCFGSERLVRPHRADRKACSLVQSAASWRSMTGRTGDTDPVEQLTSSGTMRPRRIDAKARNDGGRRHLASEPTARLPASCVRNPGDCPAPHDQKGPPSLARMTSDCLSHLAPRYTDGAARTSNV